MEKLNFIFIAIFVIVYLLHFFIKSYKKVPVKHFFSLIIAIVIFLLDIFVHYFFPETRDEIIKYILYHIWQTNIPYIISWSYSLVVLIIALVFRLISFFFVGLMLKRERQPKFIGYFWEKDTLFIKDKFYGYSRILLYSSIILAVLTIFILIFVATEQNNPFAFAIFQSSPLFVLWLEVGFYLSGKKKYDQKTTEIKADDQKTFEVIVYDEMFLQYKKHFKDFILKDIIYEKGGNEQKDRVKEIYDNIKDRPILITDPFNDSLLKILLDIVRDYTMRGFQLIIIYDEKSKALNLKKQIEENIYVNNVLFPDELYKEFNASHSIYLLSLTQFEEYLNDYHSNPRKRLPNLQLVIFPYLAVQGIESFAQLYNVFHSSAWNKSLKALFIAEKHNNIEGTIKSIMGLGDSDYHEVQNVNDQKYRRYFILWEANPIEKTYHSELVGGSIQYLPPPTVLSVVPFKTKIENIYWLFGGEYEKDSVETLKGQLNDVAKIEEYRYVDIQEKHLRIVSNYRIFEGEKRRFSFIYDKYRNLPFIFNFIDHHHNIKTEFTNLFIPRYLLRNYFLQSYKFFIKQPYYEAVFPIITWPERSVRARIWSLYKQLKKGWVEAAEIKNKYFKSENYWKIVFNQEEIKITASLIQKIFDQFAELPGKVKEEFRKINDIENKIFKVSRFITIETNKDAPELVEYYKFQVETGDHNLISDIKLTDESLVYHYKRGDLIPMQSIGDEGTI